MYSLTKSWQNLTLLVLLGSIWGTGYSIARFAMTNDVPPFGYSFWQSAGPAIIIGCLALYRNKHLTLSTANLRFYFISGLTGIVIPNTSMYYAAGHLPASVLAMVVNTVPIVAYPMALIIGLEVFKWQRILGILIAFLGLLCIVIPKTSLPSVDMVPWTLTTLITPLSFAFCSVYIARYRPTESDALSLTAGMLIASTIMLIPLVLYTHSFYLFHVPLTTPDMVIFLEIILSSVGYVLFFQLIKLAGPVYYSLVDSIVVLTGVFWGYIIFGEQLNQWTASAVVLILFALLLVTQQQRNAAKGLNTAYNES